MDESERFISQWKVEFPSQEPPNLEIFNGSTEQRRREIIRRVSSLIKSLHSVRQEIFTLKWLRNSPALENEQISILESFSYLWSPIKDLESEIIPENVLKYMDKSLSAETIILHSMAAESSHEIEVIVPSEYEEISDVLQSVQNITAGLETEEDETDGRYEIPGIALTGSKQHGLASSASNHLSYRTITNSLIECCSNDEKGTIAKDDSIVSPDVENKASITKVYDDEIANDNIDEREYSDLKQENIVELPVYAVVNKHQKIKNRPVYAVVNKEEKIKNRAINRMKSNDEDKTEQVNDQTDNSELQSEIKSDVRNDSEGYYAECDESYETIKTSEQEHEYSLDNNETSLANYYEAVKEPSSDPQEQQAVEDSMEDNLPQETLLHPNEMITKSDGDDEDGVPINRYEPVEKPLSRFELLEPEDEYHLPVEKADDDEEVLFDEDGVPLNTYEPVEKPLSHFELLEPEDEYHLSVEKSDNVTTRLTDTCSGTSEELEIVLGAESADDDAHLYEEVIVGHELRERVQSASESDEETSKKEKGKENVTRRSASEVNRLRSNRKSGMNMGVKIDNNETIPEKYLVKSSPVKGDDESCRTSERQDHLYDSVSSARAYFEGLKGSHASEEDAVFYKSRCGTTDSLASLASVGTTCSTTSGVFLPGDAGILRELEDNGHSRLGGRTKHLSYPAMKRRHLKDLDEDEGITDSVFQTDEGYEGDQESYGNLSEDALTPGAEKTLQDVEETLRRRSHSDISTQGSAKLNKLRQHAQNLDDVDDSHESAEASNKAHMLHTRKWVVASLLDAERCYIECLDKITKHMKPVRMSIDTSSPILSLSDFNKIFFKMEELHRVHQDFFNELEPRVAHWNYKQLIGDLFSFLVDQFPLYKEFIGNHKICMDTIKKCKSNEQFERIFKTEIKLACSQETITFEGLFVKPVERIARYIIVINDLLNNTPSDHADFCLLQDILKKTSVFLEEINAIDESFHKIRTDRKLLKDGILVELVEGVRKFRHLFLFNDVLICTKQKVTTSRGMHFVCKWFAPLKQLQFKRSELFESPQTVPVASQSEMDNLKAKIASTKAEIRQEQQPVSSIKGSPQTRRRKPSLTKTNVKNLERLQKRLIEQESNFLLAQPSLPLTLYNKHGKAHTFLCSSGPERADWKDIITPLLGDDIPSISTISQGEIQHLLEMCEKHRTVNALGRVSLKDEELLTGVLYVYVHSGKGFSKNNDIYCVLEVDYYGQFMRKAKTKVCKGTSEPIWQQDFDIEIEGTQALRVQCYYKNKLKMGDMLCGQETIMLRKNNLDDTKKHTTTVILDKQGCVMLTIQYSKTNHGVQRKPSLRQTGVFGVELTVVAEREQHDIPLVVIGCIKEIEKRGLDEVGIYRVSGVSSDVQKLKEAFNENSQSALVQVAEADIHAISCVLKQYFRDLPQPLFTDELFKDFVDAFDIKDSEEKETKLLDLLQSLPGPNKMTALYLFDHLRKVSQMSDLNKMGLNNLATVFGPNLLRPVVAQSSEGLALTKDSLDVFTHVAILLYFLKLENPKASLPNTPEIQNRLEPSGQKHKTVAVTLSTLSKDRII